MKIKNEVPVQFESVRKFVVRLPHPTKKRAQNLSGFFFSSSILKQSKRLADRFVSYPQSIPPNCSPSPPKTHEPPPSVGGIGDDCKFWAKLPGC